MAGERMIRGGVVDPQPREIAERAFSINIICIRKHVLNMKVLQ